MTILIIILITHTWNCVYVLIGFYYAYCEVGTAALSGHRRQAETASSLFC